MVIHDEKAERELAHRASSLTQVTDETPFERLASPINRFAAFVLDYVVIAWPVVTLTMSPAVRAMREAVLLVDDFYAYVAAAMAGITGLLTIVFYQTIFHWLAGTTPGKYVFGLRVEPLWSHRERPTFWTCFARAWCWCFQFVLLGLPFLGIMTDPNRRPLHDRLSNTIVTTRRRRQVAPPPTLYEITAARLIIWSAVAFVMTIAFSLLVREYRSLKRTFDFTGSMAADSAATCEAVDTALEDWPEEDGKEPERLSVAMALYASGELDKSCLKAEVENPMALTFSPALVYLAKSFIYSEKPDLSDMYLEQVCAESRESDECRLASVIDGLAREDDERVNVELDKVRNSSHVYLTIWALRQLLRVEDYARAENFLARLPDHPSLARFALPLRAQVLWGLQRKNESRAAAASALDVLTGYEKFQFAGWYCGEELSESCEARSSRACGAFRRMSRKADEALLEFRAALAHLKSGRCGDDEADPATPTLHPDVREFGLVLQNRDVEGLQDLWRNEELREELRDEIAIELVNLESVLPEIRENWLKRHRGLSWRRLGRKLLENDVHHRRWAQAGRLAARLWSEGHENDPSFIEKIAMAFYESGQVERAREVIESYTAEARAPAAASRLHMLRQKLMRSQ